MGLRAELRYSKNVVDDTHKVGKNGQSASKLLRPLCKDMEKVQRLNGGGFEESSKLQ